VARLSRRSFVKRAGASAAAALAAGRLRLFPSLAEDSLFQLPVQVGPAQIATYATGVADSVVRPDDFAAFRFVYVNLKKSTVTAKGPGGSVGIPSFVLERDDSSKPAYIIVYLPPQNIAEQAYYETGVDPNSAMVPNMDQNGNILKDQNGNVQYVKISDLPPTVREKVPGHESSSGEEPDAPGSVKSSLAEWSRLVFVVRPTASIPYRLDAILEAISTYDLQVTKTALPPPSVSVPSTDTTFPPVYRPNDETAETPETAIEAPYRLIISPPYYARWAHSPTPVAHNGHVELWHSRLGVWNSTLSILDELATSWPPRTIRAVWSPDYEESSDHSPKPVPDNPAIIPPDSKAPPDNKTHYNSSATALNANGPPGFRTSLDNRDRGEIVHLTSNFRMPSYSPLDGAVPVNRLMLSSLGAWIDLDGRWDPPKNLAVQEWRHLATMGRDHYVKVVYVGWLAPFGHRASLVKVTERKLQQPNSPASPTVVAYLRQRMYVVVREPVKSYPAPGQPWNGRNTPFKKLRITTLVTPDLDDPSKSAVAQKGQSAFWVRVPPGQDFEFHFIATDWDGNTSEFSAPLIFVDNSVGTGTAADSIASSELASVMDAYSSDARRKTDMNGQKIAFTSSDTGNGTATGKSTYETNIIMWKAEGYHTSKIPPPATSQTLPDYPLALNASKGDLVTNHLPLFFPAVDEADVRITAIEELAGGNPTTADSKTSKVYTPISYFGGLDTQNQNNPYGFLWNGFDSVNTGEVFARFQSATRVDLSQRVEKVGGIITPSLHYVGLSRLSGAIPGPGDTDKIEGTLKGMFGSSFNPADALLGDGLSKILGGIDLKNILSTVENLTATDFGDGTRVPKLLAEVEYDQNSGKPVDVLVTMHWEPPAQNYDSDLGSGTTDPNALFALQQSVDPYILIDAQLRKPFDPTQQPSYTVKGTISNVKLNLLAGGSNRDLVHDLVAIPFNKLEFTSQTGGKTTVSAELGAIEFHGVLKFIEELSSIIPGAGFADPPFIDVDASGIKSGFSVAVPQIPVGAIIISDLRLEALLNIPFVGAPARLSFSISEREHPFTVTYLIFGGGGFFGMRMGLDDIEMMEGALEFGAYFSLFLGTASGSVHAAAGIYFKHDQDSVQLSGYCRVGGELEVLGLISVSTEFYMCLAYADSNQNACVGQASVTVDIDLCLFSMSVTVGPVEKRFSHSPPLNQLAFGYVVPENGWKEYVAAFA
jgi:hypothetical protein